MSPTDHISSTQFRRKIYLVGGLTLVTIGIMIFLDQRLKTGWLSWLSIPVLVIVLLIAAVVAHKNSWVFSSTLMSGVLVGILLLLNPLFQIDIFGRIAALLISIGVSWILAILLIFIRNREFVWWAFIPAGIFLGAGIGFLSPLRLVDFILYPCLGLGIALMIWGIASRLLGLLIPACLVSTIGIGIFMAWRNLENINGLTQTGIMLVWFALGWGLIILVSRYILARFIWWPLIPGGVLAMVGWGLYIGGNPNQAANFISNTGGIALIIFGIYILLLRRGIRK